MWFRWGETAPRCAWVTPRWTSFRLAVVFGADGRSALVYDKHFLVPRWEDGYARGTRIVLLSTPRMKIGTLICRDMDFPAPSREYGRQNVGLMLVPAWDFTIDGWLHGRMAVLRGVENGFAVARFAKQGQMTLSDNRGRVLTQGHSSSAGPATAIGRMRVSAGRTIYSRAGDWFAWVNLAGVVAMLLPYRRVRIPFAPKSLRE
jgi:apolipoprotein N-acyltransferase